MFVPAMVCAICQTIVHVLQGGLILLVVLPYVLAKIALILLFARIMAPVSLQTIAHAQLIGQIQIVVLLFAMV